MERKTPPAAGIGRKKGTPNKTTKVLKEAILLAAEVVGEDKKGKDGLVGYLVSVAKTDKKAFCSLLGRVMPLQVEGAGENGEHLVDSTITIKLVSPNGG